jgi:hypothetical protein
MRKALKPYSRLFALALALGGCASPTSTTRVTHPPTGTIATGLGNLGSGNSIVAAGGGNIVASGGGNIVASGGGNIVASGGGNLAGGNAVGLLPSAESNAKTSNSPAVARDEITPTSNNGAGLVGLVSAPAGIIATGGGNVISPNGSNIIATGGGNLHLLALTQQPLANAQVTLLNAQGGALKDANGKPLVATTDAKGQYAFKGPLPAGNLLVDVSLAQGKGELKAIAVPPGAGSTAAVSANVDLASTLATDFLITSIVKGQPDPQATLNRLGAKLASDTVAKIATAFDAGGAKVPTAFTPDLDTAAVQVLQGNDAALAAQLKADKDAMVAAGQADLGSGRLGTQVSIKAPHVLDLAADGSLYVASGDYVVWHLLPDGTAVKAAGIGSQGTADINGQPATLAAMARAVGIALDSQNRLCIYEEGGRLSRVEADGTLHVLIKGFAPNVWAGGLVAAGDTLYVFSIDETNNDVTLTSVAPNGQAVPVHVFKADELSYYIYKDMGLGADAQGRIYLSTGTTATTLTGGSQLVKRIDPATFGVTTLVDTRRDNLEGVTVDPAGNLFEVVSSTRELDVVKPDASRIKVVDHLIAGLNAYNNQGAVLAPDGSVYMGAQGQVYHVTSAATTVVLGATDTSTGSAFDLALEEPYGLAFGSAGELYVADRWKSHIELIDSHQTASLYAGGGQGGDGSPALQAAIPSPLKLQINAAGDLFALSESDSGIKRIAHDGTHAVSTLFNLPGHIIHDFVLEADGGITFVEVDHRAVDGLGKNTYAATLQHWAPAGTPQQLVNVTTGDASFSLARDPSGSCYVVSEGLLRRWSAASGLVSVKQDRKFSTAYGTGLTCDARGRVIGPFYGTIYRYDPQADTFTLLAGSDATNYGGAISPNFAGSGVNDSLQWPAYPTFAANGDLYISDKGHKQVKSIPASKLPG